MPPDGPRVRKQPSPAKLRANRTNAKRSTGPRTREGKARAGQNAWRHGLSLAAAADPQLQPLVGALASRLSGRAADAALCATAETVAEAQMDLQRIRRWREELLGRLEALEGGDRREQGAGAPAAASAPRRGWLGNLRDRRKKVQAGSAGTFSDVLSELERLERYERRAFSRRKRAMRILAAMIAVNPDAHKS